MSIYLDSGPPDVTVAGSHESLTALSGLAAASEPETVRVTVTAATAPLRVPCSGFESVPAQAVAAARRRITEEHDHALRMAAAVVTGMVT
jgi:hypothetical protein